MLVVGLACWLGAGAEWLARRPPVLAERPPVGVGLLPALVALVAASAALVQQRWRLGGSAAREAVALRAAGDGGLEARLRERPSLSGGSQSASVVACVATGGSLDVPLAVWRSLLDPRPLIRLCVGNAEWFGRRKWLGGGCGYGLPPRRVTRPRMARC